MSFANPTALFWLLLAIPIFGLHLLKSRVRTVRVSTMMFWDQVTELEQTRRLSFNLRHWISLLLQLLLLCFLVLTVARPSIGSGNRKPRRIIVVLDNSASMQSVSEQTTRFELAKQQVSQIVEGLQMGDQMAILTTSPGPHVACGFTQSARTLANSLDAAQATDCAAKLTASLDMASQLLNVGGDDQIICVTDTVEDKSASANSLEDIRWAFVGGSVDNTAITQFQVRRSPADPAGFEILLEVSSFSGKSLQNRVELRLNDSLIDVFPLTLNPGDVWLRNLDYVSSEGGVLTASLSESDSLEIDNNAWSVLPERERIKVILVTEGQWFLQQVLESQDSVDLVVSQEIPQTIDPEAILILDRPDFQQLPDSKLIVVTPTSSNQLWDVGEQLIEPLVAQQNTDSVLMRHVDLTNVQLPSARTLQFRVDAEVLVETVEGDALYARIQRDSGDVLVLAVDLANGDLPLRTSFPIMITNALNELSGNIDRSQLAIVAGKSEMVELPEYLQVTDSALPNDLKIVAPDGEVALATVVDGRLANKLDQIGVWNVRATQDSATDNSESEWLIACNLVDRNESDLRVGDHADSGQAVEVSSSTSRPAWFYLLIASLCLTSAEWYCFHRRWIG